MLELSHLREWLKGADDMLSVSAFAPSDIDEVAALWRSLHPDWTWLDDRARLTLLFERQDARERMGYVVRRHNAVIATVFTTCPAPANEPQQRLITIKTQPADVTAEWLDPILASFADADRERPDTRHVTSLAMPLASAAAPLLEAAGFVRHSTQTFVQWDSAPMVLVDPSPAKLQRYHGGDRDIDRAIVDLHNRAYRPSEMGPRIDSDGLWAPSPGLLAREYMLAWDGGRLAGLAEWFATHSIVAVEDLAVARSHWGTSLAAAILGAVMQLLFELGYRHVKATVRSNNAAAMRLALNLGWKLDREWMQTFVRRV
jgi:GNAT superfamily N-acetyltransferase